MAPEMERVLVALGLVLVLEPVVTVETRVLFLQGMGTAKVRLG